MSDLVERIHAERNARALDPQRAANPILLEAATAMTAKDKEIEALREQKESLDREAATYCKWWREEKTRAETAERERDEARAALKALPQHTICDDCGKEILHNEANWADDGSSYCPSCRTIFGLIADRPAPPARS